MGTQPTLKEKSEAAGITEVRPFKEIETYLKNAQQKGQPIHYLPTYRAEHQIKLFQWLASFREPKNLPYLLLWALSTSVTIRAKKKLPK